MSIFDSLKKQVAHAAYSVAAKGYYDVVSFGEDESTENRTYKVTLSQLPLNLAQLQAMPEGDLKNPEKTAALTVASLIIFPKDRKACFEMLDFLQGPRGLSEFDKQFIADRFRDKDYIPRSYFDGSTPENNYEPSQPYTLTFFENRYSRDNYSEGYLILHIKSGGADSPRQIKLRKKPSTGQWFLWEQFLLPDIRKPSDEDQWA